MHDWLTVQRHPSHRTVLADRASGRLCRRCVAAGAPRPVAHRALTHLSATAVLALLAYLEQARHVTIAPRNCRLAALRRVFACVAADAPLAAAQCAAVLRLPTNRRPRRDVCDLEVEEVAAILAQPDRSTLAGQRDHARFAGVYHTGARSQEALALDPRALHVDAPAHARRVGQGHQERLCPLGPATADLLAAWRRRQPRWPHAPLFVHRSGHPLGAAGVRSKLQRYVQGAAQHVPSLATTRVTPPIFRPTTAVHLVAAGGDVSVMRSGLGPAHLDTTHRYAQATLDTNRAARAQLAPHTRSAPPPVWTQDDALLAWLESLSAGQDDVKGDETASSMPLGKHRLLHITWSCA